MPLDRSDRRRGQEKTEVSQLMSERSTVVICWVEIARMERSDDRMLSDLHHSLPSVPPLPSPPVPSVGDMMAVSLNRMLPRPIRWQGKCDMDVRMKDVD